MGIYVNPSNTEFIESLSSEIYVDKTDLLNYTNKVINTKDKFICSSRPRRFGKSMALQMMKAYYSKGCNSEKIFENLEISHSDRFKEHLNKYDLIAIDIQNIIIIAKKQTEGKDINLLDYLEETVIEELREKYPNCIKEDTKSLAQAILEIYLELNVKFIVLIDEWDYFLREKPEMTEEYIEFLRSIFKGAVADNCIALAYMTGILPIKKYNTQSALNNFKEFTMLNSIQIAKYIGFTEEEVKELCDKYDVDFDEMKKWYDGYELNAKDRIYHIYNPKSVVSSILDGGYFESYWVNTESYETLKMYIESDFEGLKEDIIKMLAGEDVRVNTRSFQNDMVSINSKDDVLTLLIHLGYLSYNIDTGKVRIPNQEIAIEFENTITASNWGEISKLLLNSEDLLEDTINMKEKAVAEAIDRVHIATTNVFNYNDENSLRCVVQLAYFTSIKDYTILHELNTGKGRADLFFLPRKKSSKPALLIELKFDDSADDAIEQIRNRQYGIEFKEYENNMLIVGISYDRDKGHSCRIEKY